MATAKRMLVAEPASRLSAAAYQGPMPGCVMSGCVMPGWSISLRGPDGDRATLDRSGWVRHSTETMSSGMGGRVGTRPGAVSWGAPRAGSARGAGVRISSMPRLIVRVTSWRTSDLNAAEASMGWPEAAPATTATIRIPVPIRLTSPSCGNGTVFAAMAPTASLTSGAAPADLALATTGSPTSVRVPPS